MILRPGPEGRHTINGLVLGDYQASPEFVINDIVGWRQSPEGEANADPKGGEMGELPRRSVRRGKTLSYDVTIKARSLGDLRYAQALRDAAFAEFDSEVQCVVAPQPGANYGGRSVLPVTFTARCLSCDPATEKPKSPHRPGTHGYEQDFALALRMYDPRFYLADPVVAQTAAISSTAGVSLPAMLPVTIPAPGASAGSGAIDLSAGTADTDPTVEIHGPIANPVVSNETVGARLQFAGLAISQGQILRIDFRRRTITMDGQSYRNRLVRSLSNWWDAEIPKLTAGSNVIRLAGEQMADPAKAVVTAYPACL